MINEKVVREQVPKNRPEGNLDEMLGGMDLLEMPFDFRIYLMGKLAPTFVPLGNKSSNVH